MGYFYVFSEGVLLKICYHRGSHPPLKGGGSDPPFCRYQGGNPLKTPKNTLGFTSRNPFFDGIRKNRFQAG